MDFIDSSKKKIFFIILVEEFREISFNQDLATPTITVNNSNDLLQVQDKKTIQKIILKQ